MLAGNAIIMIIANKLQNLLTLRVSDEGHFITGRSVTLRVSDEGHSINGWSVTLRVSDEGHSITGWSVTLRVSDESHSITGWSVTLRVSDEGHSITGSCVLNYIFTFLLMLNNNLSKTMCHSLIICFINSLYIHISIHKCDNKRRYLI
jgi:hypothetical protein